VLLVFRCDCKVFGCISSKSEQNWWFSFRAGVMWCILYLYIIHILLYIYYILYYILYITIIILFSSSIPFPSFSSNPSSSDLPYLPNNLYHLSFPSLPYNPPSSSSNIHSILVGTYIYLFISHPIFQSHPLPNPFQTRYPSLKGITHLSLG
jgi:hypothetical protein